jgi:glycosyltransferase involved in cell wall biosynthesis
MSRSIRVSIIMSVFNGDKYLNTAIDAILNQTFSDFEFIIINDGSTDKTCDILRSYTDPRIRVFNQNNRGLIQSLNRGISLASGEYIARQDADDISLPDRIKEQVKIMDNDPKIVLVGSSYYSIDDNDDLVDFVKVPQTDTEIRWKMIFTNAFCHTSIMTRSETLKNNKLFYNENDIHAEDYGLWSRLIQYGSCYNIGKPLVKYRVHPNQISNVYFEIQNDKALLISKKNIEGIGMNIQNLDAIRKLKDLEYNVPSRLDNGYIDIYKYYIQLLSKFMKEKYINKVHFKKIMRLRFYHICNSINIKNIREVYISGLLYEIIKVSKLYFLENILIRGVRKLI